MRTGRDALTRGVDMDPDEDPEAFLQALSERLDGTYVFATEPHAEAECEHASVSTRESAPA